MKSRERNELGNKYDLEEAEALAPNVVLQDVLFVRR